MNGAGRRYKRKNEKDNQAEGTKMQQVESGVREEHIDTNHMGTLTHRDNEREGGAPLRRQETAAVAAAAAEAVEEE